MWFIRAFVIAGIVFACYSAEAQFPQVPKSRPSSAPQVQAQVQAPQAPPTVNVSPPSVNVAPPTVNVAAPTVTVSPQLVAPPATTMDEIKSWLNTTFLGLLAAIGSWIGIRGVKNAGTVTSGGPPALVADVLAKLTDPAVQKSLEARGLQVALTAVESGIPKSLIQGAVGLAPMGGTVNAAYDATVGPLIHSLGVKMLQDIIAKRTTETAP